VTATAAQVQASTAELGTAIARTEVNDLPLNGRNFTQLLALTPGVSPISTAQNSGGGDLWAGNTIGTFTFPSVNGANNRANFFFLDGFNDQQSMIATVGTTPILDSIQEFKVQSHNDSSQFGGALGGIINVVTKSGTNEYHGGVWEFLRNNALDARNFFSANTIPYKQNQFGGMIGGPLRPGGTPKTWFFAGYEGYRSVRAASRLLNVPTRQELTGDLSAYTTTQIYNPFTTRPDPALPGQYLRDPFMCDASGNPLEPGVVGTPCNKIPTSLIAQDLVNYVLPDLPTPINTGVAGYNVIDNTPNRIRQDTATLRFDRQFSERTSGWLRYTGFTQPDSVSGGYPGSTSNLFEHGYQAATSITHTFGGGSKVLTVGFGRNTQQINLINKLSVAENLGLEVGFDPSFASGATRINAATVGGINPSVGMTGFDSRPSIGLTNLHAADIWEWKADFTWVRGRHTIGMGLDLNTDNLTQPLASSSISFSSAQTSNLESPAGTGSALASMLLGVVDGANYRNLKETVHDGWVDGFYIQDSWKATNKLTVNIGLRYEFRLWPVYGSLEDNNQYVGNYDLDRGLYIVARVPPKCDVAAGVGAPCIPTPDGSLPEHVIKTPFESGAIYHNTYDNWGPRLGLAYRLRPTTVIRAAGVKFFDNWGGQLSNSQAYEGSWPSMGQQIISNANYPTSDNALPSAMWDNPFNAGAAGPVMLPAATPFQQVMWFVDPHGQNAYSLQWNFGVQQSLGTSTLLEADYVGSHSSRLDLDGYRNQALYPAPGDQAPRRPFPYITPTFFGKSVGKSSYNAFQFRLRRSESKGLSYIISYTWSKNINYACDGWFGAEGCNITQLYNMKADRAAAGFDVPHMLVTSWTYELPFGKGKTFATGNKVLDAVVGPWSINGIYTIRSGEPFNLGVSGDIPNVGASSVRPDIVGPLYSGARTPEKWFNTSAFVVPAAYTFGNFGRNVLRQTRSSNFDMSVFRNIQLPFSEATRLEFRAEFFNAWNQAWLGGCLDTTVQSSNFGKASCTRNTEREIQFALKLYF
jgi:hypothetical protein